MVRIIERVERGGTKEPNTPQTGSVRGRYGRRRPRQSERTALSLVALAIRSAAGTRFMC